MNVNQSKWEPPVVFIRNSEGLRLAVREAGIPAGRPLLFIHGFMGGSLSWDAIQSGPLAREFRLVMVDLRGHGDSDKPADPAAYGNSERWSDDLASIVRELDLRDIVLVAHSYGGSIAMDYLRHAGADRVAGVFLAAAAVEHPSCNPACFHPEAASMLRPIVGAGLPQRVRHVQAFLRTLTARKLVPELFEPLLAQAMVATPLMLAGAFSRKPRSNADVLADLKCPVAFLMGDQENVVTPAMASFVRSNAPQTQLISYPNVGHLPQLEAADAMARDLAGFARD